MQARKSSSRQRWLTTATVGIAALVLLAIVGLSYRQWLQFRRSNAQAARAREVSDSCDRVLSNVLDAETGQRGYLLTGDARYLDPYNRAVRALPGDLASLQALLDQTPGGSQSFAQLNTLVEDKLSELGRTIQVRRTQGSAPALAMVMSDQGKQRMDAIRALTHQLQQNENAVLGKSSVEGEAVSGTVLLATAMGALILFFLFAFGLEPFASPESSAWKRPWPLRYGAAVLSVLAVALFRAALIPLIGRTELPFTLFFFAVAFAAWFGGFGPAVLSIVLSLLTATWFFAAPTHSLWVGRHDDQVAVLMIVVVGFAVAFFTRSQRSAVERALRSEDSERIERQRFETTLDSIGDAVIATDALGRITFVNRVACQLLKWPEADAQGRPLDQVFRIVNEVTRVAVESPVARVLREGKVVGLANHTILIGKDGTEVPIDDSAAPIHDAQGKILGTVLVFRDISEKRAAEKQLAAQATELRQRAEIMEHAQLLVRDMEDRIGYWNRGAELLYGYTAAEALGQSSHSLLQTRFPVPQDTIRAQLMSKGEWHGELGHVKRDGSNIIVASYWRLHRDVDGHPVAVLEVNTDITERKQIGDELRRERERLGLALTAGKMGVFEMNCVEKTFWWSPETYSLFGVNPAEFELSRDSFAALIHPQDREEFMQYWDENVAELHPINHEFRLLKPDGQERWISCRGTPRNDDARSPYYSGLFVDITERREAEQVLRRFEKLSAAARLSAAIAHEINNPLSAVGNLIYLARKSPDMPAPIMEFLVLAEQELERVAHAARQALGFYRESSRAEAIDVPELIESVLKVFSNRIEDKKIRVVRAFAPCEKVYAVRGEIRQLISNLLVNAIEAVRPEGLISLATRQVNAGKDHAIEIVVADDGHGIAPENLNQIFEPFFSTKPGTGTGLGLWAAREIVERHHGKIDVQCGGSDGRGAAFTVRLPSESGARILDRSADPGKSVRPQEQVPEFKGDPRQLG